RGRDAGVGSAPVAATRRIRWNGRSARWNSEGIGIRPCDDPAMAAVPAPAVSTALSSAVPTLLTAVELGAVRRPFKAARLLPPRVFHDPAILEYELTNWFGRDWICVGREEEAANRGEYVLATVGGENVM